MIIILEGMSTVGKTMVQKSLDDILSKENIDHKTIDQNEGLPPETFEHLNPKKSLEFLHKYLKENCQNPSTVYIFDRLHLSHFAITNGSDEYMSEIEEELLKYDPLLVLLTVDEARVKERLISAIKYRGDRWVKELEKRETTGRTATDFHIGTQRKHVKQYEESKLPKIVFDVTNSDFQTVAEQIFEKYIKTV